MKKNAIWSIIIVICLIFLISSCSTDSEYERAGKEFGTWASKNPSSWTDTQKQHFNDFGEWANKNQTK